MEARRDIKEGGCMHFALNNRFLAKTFFKLVRKKKQEHDKLRFIFLKVKLKYAA